MFLRRIRLLSVFCLIFVLSGTVSFASINDFPDAVENLYQQTSYTGIEKLDVIIPPDDAIEEIVPGKLVIKFKDQAEVHAKTLQSMSNSMIQSIDKTKSSGILTVNLAKDTDMQQAIELLSKQPGVEFVEPLYIYRVYETESEQPQTVSEAVYEPNDPYYRKKMQWGLQAINVSEIWNKVPAEKRSQVTIAIIDSGVDLDHPDLKDSIIGGYDFVNNDNDPDDDNGHGTHVAGIAAAITDNGTGIAGVAGGAKIMPVKVMNSRGLGTSLDIYLGIMYAVNNGADVINLSLGSNAPSQLIKNAVDYAIENDVVVVAATGNDYISEVGFPAAFEGVIGVGAVDYYNKNVFVRADFSNYGPETDIVAPGVDILSTFPIELDTFDGKIDGYTLLDGTSMAAPFVAGMAALLKADNPDLSCKEIQKVLQENAYDIFENGWDIETGAGVVNGSTGEIKIPDIFEFPRIVVYLYPVPPNNLYILINAEKSKGITDESFNGDIEVDISQIISSPFDSYFIYPMIYGDKDMLKIEETGQIELKSTNETIDSVTVPVEDGEGFSTYTFSNSGFYSIAADIKTVPEDYFPVNSNSIYRVRINDASISGNIHLEKPFEKDAYVLIQAVNEIYSMYIDAGMANPILIPVPKGEVSVPYTLNVPRDKNYKVYYIFYRDNDIYYNYGFYKSPSETTLNPADFTPIDLTKGSVTGIDLNINTVEDLDDDVSDTRDGATEISMKGFEPGSKDIKRFSLEYKGDRDFFKVEIDKKGDYFFYAVPTETSSPMLKVVIYDSSGSIVAAYAYYTYTFPTVSLNPGTYYIKVEDETCLETFDYDFIYGIDKEASPDTIIDFEDENLEKAIRDLLGKPESEPVYVSDVSGFEMLDLSSMNISSIKGLEYFHNLWCLELGHNNITDISPLSNLINLEILDLNENNISDLSPLCNLGMLWELDASKNKISELPEDLSRMSTLNHLDLSDNEIEDISSLATLSGNIECLFLANNKIASIEALSGLETLKVLHLKGNPVIDYTPLKSYYLNLRDKDFYALPAAEDVSISGNKKVGSTLTGAYTYSNMNNHAEKGTTFRWLRADSFDGEYTAIEGATGKTYTLKQSDLGKYIKFEVTPGADGEPSKGLPAASLPYGPIERADRTGGDDNGSGSGSGPGSGSTPTPTPTPAPEPTQAPAPTPVIEIASDENGQNILTADATNLQLSWDTIPVIDITTGSDVDKAEIIISAGTIRDSIKNNQPFGIRFNGVLFIIQPGTVTIPESAEKVTLSVNYLTGDELPEEMSTEDAVGVSMVFDFQLTVDGNPVTGFDKPVSVTIQLIITNINNPDKVGVYYFNEQENKWIFIGGKVNDDGTITFATPHFSKFQAMESTKTFSDIQDHWAKDDIEIMAARHVTQGTGDNKFNPNAYITRAEFTAMIVRALNITEKTSSNPFTDVKPGDWFADTVLRANAAGIILGDSKGYFSPGSLITREEMAAIAVRAYSYYSGENPDRIITTQEIRFKDMDQASEWARKSITLADALGLMNGFSDKTFRPRNYTTRAEAIVVVKRLMKLLEIF